MTLKQIYERWKMHKDFDRAYNEIKSNNYKINDDGFVVSRNEGVLRLGLTRNSLYFKPA